MVGNLIDELSGLFIKANTKEAFLSHLSDGKILNNSVVFIMDTSEIWTLGKYWPCPYSKEEIDALFSLVNNNIDLVRALYSELNTTLIQYQLSTNLLIAEKEQTAATALAAEVARASELESRIASQIATLSSSLNTEIGRATAAEEALRNNKVDKEEGKSLVSDTEITKLAGLSDLATITASNKITLTEVSSSTLYKLYSISLGENQIGTIDIPKDLTITGGSIKTVTEADKPYTGAVIGDKYFDFETANTESGHIYIEANDLVDTYTLGNGILVLNKVISVKIDSSSEGFLTLSGNGIKLSGVLAAINVKYTKPSTGIPKSDLESGVLASLGKADTALQEHQSLVAYAKTADVNVGLSTKVDKVTGKSLISDTLITKLEGLNDLATTMAAIADAKKAGTDALAALDGKVDKVSGKGLSTNDYTTNEKTKLSGIESGANKTVVDSALSSTSTNPVQNKILKTSIDEINTKISWKTIE